MKPWHFPSAAILALAAADPALAHTMGGSVAGFGAGFSHPMLGMDHLLAMLAIGLWAAQAGTAAAWRIPLAFVVTLAAGDWLYALGFLSATGLLHLMGFVAGKAATGLTLRICGGIIAAAGLFAAAT